MAEKARCEICDKTFKDANGLEQHNEAKHGVKRVESKKPVNTKKVRNWAIFLVIVVGAVALIWWGASSRVVLPPSDDIGHIEANPASHVLRVPMNILVHKHMLEHMDGIEGGRGGAIINYNCEDYECEDGLIEKLEAFAGTYQHVYVAPFDNMDAKIVLTKLNRQEILEEFDEDRIDVFVR